MLAPELGGNDPLGASGEGLLPPERSGTGAGCPAPCVAVSGGGMEMPPPSRRQPAGDGTPGWGGGQRSAHLWLPCFRIPCFLGADILLNPEFSAPCYPKHPRGHVVPFSPPPVLHPTPAKRVGVQPRHLTETISLGLRLLGCKMGLSPAAHCPAWRGCK